MNIVDIKKRLYAYNEFKELAAQNKADFENIHNAQNMFNVNSARDMAYLLHIIDLLEQDLTYMKQYGELTNLDGKMKLCIERALQAIRKGD